MEDVTRRSVIYRTVKMATSTAFSRVQIGGVELVCFRVYVFMCLCVYVEDYSELQQDVKSRKSLVDVRKARVLDSSCLSSVGRPPLSFLSPSYIDSHININHYHNVGIHSALAV